jgi:hypothetical protein
MWSGRHWTAPHPLSDTSQYAPTSARLKKSRSCSIDELPSGLIILKEGINMAVKKTRKVAGVAVAKGEKMTIGIRWKLVHKGANGERAFVGTLKSTRARNPLRNRRGSVATLKRGRGSKAVLEQVRVLTSAELQGKVSTLAMSVHSAPERSSMTPVASTAASVFSSTMNRAPAGMLSSTRTRPRCSRTM